MKKNRIDGYEKTLVCFYGVGQFEMTIPLYHGFSFEDCVKMTSRQIESYVKDGTVYHVRKGD